MRRIRLSVAAVAVAASFVAAPAAQAADPLEKVKQTVRCVGEALAGHTCHT